MYSMPCTPLTCSSIGKATVFMTVEELAPGYRVVTPTVGGIDVGILRHRQRVQRDGSDDHHDDRQNVGEHRPVDEEFGDHCFALPLICTSFGATFSPGEAF